MDEDCGCRGDGQSFAPALPPVKHKDDRNRNDRDEKEERKETKKIVAAARWQQRRGDHVAGRRSDAPGGNSHGLRNEGKGRGERGVQCCLVAHSSGNRRRSGALLSCDSTPSISRGRHDNRESHNRSVTSAKAPYAGGVDERRGFD